VCEGVCSRDVEKPRCVRVQERQVGKEGKRGGHGEREGERDRGIERERGGDRESERGETERVSKQE